MGRGAYSSAHRTALHPPFFLKEKPMQLDKKSPIAQVAGMKPPVKRTRLPDGSIVEEKVPPGPYVRKIVTRSGTVSYLTLSTGRTISEGPNNGYGILKLEEKKQRGALLYAECPYATGALIRPDGVEPCRGTHPDRVGVFWTKHPADNRRYVEDECCEHIEQIIKERSAAHNAKQEEFAEEWLKQQRATMGISETLAAGIAAAGKREVARGVSDE